MRRGKSVIEGRRGHHRGEGVREGRASESYRILGLERVIVGRAS